MSELRKFVITSGVAIAMVSGLAWAATPFGADDSGSIPPDAPKGPVTRCENLVAKNVSKLASDIIKCHIARAGGKLVDDTAEDACEATATTKFEVAKLTGCTACTDVTATAVAIESLVDKNGGKIYCSVGTPFGGDDKGNIPPDAPTGPVTRCENAVAKNVGKLMAGLIKCHIARASGKLVDDTAEEACEATAQTKFQVTNPQGCTACTNLVALSATVETLIDNANGLAYCAP